MADRPESGGTPVYYEWATNDVQQVVIKNNEARILDNKAPPLPEFTSFGLRYGQPLDFPQINYQFNGYSLWIQHLDQRYSVGDLHHTTSLETVGDISTRLGGTWALLDTQTIGGESVKIYEKTA